MQMRASREETLYTGPEPSRAFARAREPLWRYRFYPPSIVSGELERPSVGALIHQTIRAGPLRFRAPVRIVEVWDEPARCGYRYEALPGHAERGWAEFDLACEEAREEARGEVRFRMASDAAFAHWLARLGAPLARRHRERAIDAAFKRMREAARGEEIER